MVIGEVLQDWIGCFAGGDPFHGGAGVVVRQGKGPLPEADGGGFRGAVWWRYDGCPGFRGSMAPSGIRTAFGRDSIIGSSATSSFDRGGECKCAGVASGPGEGQNRDKSGTSMSKSVSSCEVRQLSPAAVLSSSCLRIVHHHLTPPPTGLALSLALKTSSLRLLVFLAHPEGARAGRGSGGGEPEISEGEGVYRIRPAGGIAEEGARLSPSPPRRMGTDLGARAARRQGPILRAGKNMSSGSRRLDNPEPVEFRTPSSRRKATKR